MKRKLYILAIIFLFSFMSTYTYTHAQDTLTEKKISNNSVLTVGTIERPPFSIGKHPDSLKGFSIELRKSIALKLDLEYQFQVFTGFSDMIDSVTTGNIDIAAANISITAEREEFMDFSFPTYDGGLRILVRNDNSIKNKYSSLEKIKNIILNNDLLRILSVVLFAIIILLITFTIYPRYRKKHFLMISFYLIGLSILVFIITQTKSTEYQENSAYSISSYKDLVGEKVGVGKNTTMSKFLDRKGISYKAYPDYKKSLIALESGQVDAIIADAPVAEYYASHSGKNKVNVVGKIFSPDKIAFAIKQNSSLLEEVNTVLLEMKESGEYKKLKKKWFGR